MDPDAVLQELRELYNLAQDDAMTAEDGVAAVCLFDDLDNWIISGGFLPKEWQR